MQFQISNKIIVSNPTPEMLAWCKGNLTIPNPEFYKKQQLGKWCGNIPRNIVLYEKDTENLYLPFGTISQLCKQYKDRSMYDMRIVGIRPVDYKSDIHLYDYQEEAVQKALSMRNGVIVMPCGAGKTQTALELVSRIGGKCLWLTHTADLLNQSMNRAKANLGVARSTYGTITGGKVNIGSGITFATVQTMAKIDLEQYKNTFDIIVVDECHKCVGTPTRIMQFYKVLSALSCRYKFGITATPYRNDKLHISMFALIGSLIHEVPKEAVASTTCPVRVETVYTGYMPNLDTVLSGDGTIQYASLVDDLINDHDRFVCVVDKINCLSGPILVLANRVEYLQSLCGVFRGKAVCLSGMGNSKAMKEHRKTVLKELNEGTIDCVFATYQLAKEGLDVPNLQYVVFATPEKDETTVVQSAGRVGRKAEGKAYGTIVDFVDNFGMLKGWAKKREGYYKKLDYGK